MKSTFSGYGYFVLGLIQGLHVGLSSAMGNVEARQIQHYAAFRVSNITTLQPVMQQPHQIDQHPGCTQSWVASVEGVG